MEEVKTITRDMKKNKSVGGEIPTQVLKESEFIFEILTNCISKFIETGSLPNSLKEANITHIFRKDDPLGKSNYRLVSILPLISKCTRYIESFLSDILCGFRKVHNTQYALFKLLQSWQKELDNGGFVGTILMDIYMIVYHISH